VDFVELWDHVLRELSLECFSYGRPITLPFSGGTVHSRIDASLDGRSRLRIDHRVHTDPELNTDHILTRASALAPGSARLALHVKHGYVYPLGKILGFQDITVGHPTFDDVFVVKGNHEELARTWLGARCCDTLLAAREQEFQVRRGRASTPWHRHREPITLIATLRALSALAGRGWALADEWEKAAQALGGELHGESSGGHHCFSPIGELWIDTDRYGSSARVDAWLGGIEMVSASRSLYVRASCRRPGPSFDGFAILDERSSPSRKAPPRTSIGSASLGTAYTVHAAEPERVTGRLTPRALELMSAVRPTAVVTAEDRVIAYLRGFEGDAGRLAAALELVALLAEDRPVDSGPYR
jgi:hypothetical protein